MSGRRHAPWQVAERRRVFSGGPVREIAVERVVLPNGREMDDYYRIDLADFALVFAITEDDDVLLLRQYKHGVGRACTTCPGGAIGVGESPLGAAKRELLEETGFVSDAWTPLGELVTNANQRCNVAHLFIARACRRIGEASAPDLEDPELVRIPVARLWSVLQPTDVGLASHVALLALATHAAFTGEAREDRPDHRG
jgi:ADP-ribose pyrophosphatase